METPENKPPIFFLKVFRWFCNVDFQEEIEGDLIEMYKNNFEQYGNEKAKWLFIKEVLFLFRPTLIGNVNQLTNLNSTFMIAKNRRLIGIVATVPALLLILFVAKQFSNEVTWSIFDFIVMGILLLSVGLLCELVMRKIKTTKNRIIICCIVLIIFFLVWAELAVGIFGTPFAGN